MSAFNLAEKSSTTSGHHSRSESLANNEDGCNILSGAEPETHSMPMQADDENEEPQPTRTPE